MGAGERVKLLTFDCRDDRTLSVALIVIQLLVRAALSRLQQSAGVIGNVDDPIPPSIVKRTKIIEVEFYAADCVPCDAQ